MRFLCKSQNRITACRRDAPGILGWFRVKVDRARDFSLEKAREQKRRSLRLGLQEARCLIAGQSKKHQDRKMQKSKNPCAQIVCP